MTSGNPAHHSQAITSTGDELRDPQRAPGLARAMQRARVWADEYNYRQDPGGAGPSPLEAAERDELAAIADQQARAAQAAAAPPAAGGQAAAPASTGDAELDAHLGAATTAAPRSTSLDLAAAAKPPLSRVRA